MRTRSLLLAGLFAALAAGNAGAQTFGIGAGGAAVNDTGTASNVSGFRNAEGHLFVEGLLEPGVIVQLRASRFTLPGTALNAPDVTTTGVLASAGYEFREEWFRAGFFAGAGLYHLSPKDPGAGQVVQDAKEDVFGWHGGVSTTFALARQFDFRLEALVHSIRSGVSHTPIFLGGSIVYRF